MILFWNAIVGRQHEVAKEDDIAGSALYASGISGDFFHFFRSLLVFCFYISFHTFFGIILILLRGSKHALSLTIENL